MNSEKGKIYIVVIILLVLISGIFVVRKLKKPQEASPVIQDEETVAETITEAEPKSDYAIYLKSDKINLNSGEEINVRVSFSAPGKKIFGSDLIILFDPEFLITDQANVFTGSFFASYPRITVDAENGIIKVSAYQGKSALLDELLQDIININFQALKKGTTTIDLSFTPGETNTSTLVEADSSQNILERVEELTVTIEE